MAVLAQQWARPHEKGTVTLRKGAICDPFSFDWKFQMDSHRRIHVVVYPQIKVQASEKTEFTCLTGAVYSAVASLGRWGWRRASAASSRTWLSPPGTWGHPAPPLHTWCRPGSSGSGWAAHSAAPADRRSALHPDQKRLTEQFKKLIRSNRYWFNQHHFLFSAFNIASWLLTGAVNVTFQWNGADLC